MAPLQEHKAQMAGLGLDTRTGLVFVTPKSYGHLYDSGLERVWKRYQSRVGCPVSIRLMGGVNLVDRCIRLFRSLLVAENAVGIVIVTRLSRGVNPVVVPASISLQVLPFSCRHLASAGLQRCWC